MFQSDKWPFTPTRLSEIVDSETLAVVEAGCSSRLGRALTILDYSPDQESFGYRIESINPQQHWEKFCALLRNRKVIAGGDRACQDCDLREARISLAEFRKSGAISRACPCHMGLYGMTHVVRVHGRPVALLISGQHRPARRDRRHHRKRAGVGHRALRAHPRRR